MKLLQTVLTVFELHHRLVTIHASQSLQLNASRRLSSYGVMQYSTSATRYGVMYLLTIFYSNPEKIKDPCRIPPPQKKKIIYVIVEQYCASANKAVDPSGVDILIAVNQ